MFSSIRAVKRAVDLGICRRFFATSNLKGVTNVFRSLAVDETSLPASDADFPAVLASSMAQWKAEGIRGVWLKVPQDRSGLVSVAVQNNFTIHHAKPGYIMLTSWLVEGEKSRLPHFGQCSIGVGGFVYREDTQQILLISEKHSIAATSNSSNPSTPTASASSHTPSSDVRWKLPGGLQDVGESLAEAAEREVWEETGVRTKFHSVVGFRHLTNFRWGNDDIYFVCRLNPLSYEINACPHEIGACEWVSVKDFLQDTRIYPLQAAAIRLALDATLKGSDASTHSHDGDGLRLDILNASVTSTSPYQMIYRLDSSMSTVDLSQWKKQGVRPPGFSPPGQ
eukprot:GILI01045668.1.p1 GENE.GILI01045668.1~~GILI01045668.1.p1  ORF type:complete len:338 (+),score=69.59 GILI01045668.1:108-1121(+)